ncbi:uncharacterized protein LOC134776821 [Penaeus indicus]|uniref:uncharacterized protein LOC134776821 n=1 Tax=Penaeus indicus TaxID=29960 RepID=UPI00300D7FAE
MDLKLVLLVAASALLAEAYPRFVAVPSRIAARSYPMYYPQESRLRPVVSLVEDSRPVVIIEEEEPQQWELDEASSDRYERQSGGYGGGNDHVDYGAYTGGYGAFGWYSDHPVCINCGSHH